MITWEYFSKRRNIDLEKFIQKQNIKTYEELYTFCTGREVIPPTKNEYDLVYDKVFPVKKQESLKVTTKTPPKPVKKKRAYVRKKKPTAKKK